LNADILAFKLVENLLFISRIVPILDCRDFADGDHIAKPSKILQLLIVLSKSQ